MSPLQLLLLTLTTSTITHARVTYVQNTPPTSTFTCPPEDIIRTHCLGPKDCLYPNPDKCNGFIQCGPKDENYTTGIAYYKDCPASLQWNDNKKVCDYASQSTCQPHGTGSMQARAEEKKRHIEKGPGQSVHGDAGGYGYHG